MNYRSPVHAGLLNSLFLPDGRAVEYVYQEGRGGMVFMYDKHSTGEVLERFELSLEKNKEDYKTLGKNIQDLEEIVRKMFRRHSLPTGRQAPRCGTRPIRLVGNGKSKAGMTMRKQIPRLRGVPLRSE